MKNGQKIKSKKEKQEYRGHGYSRLLNDSILEEIIKRYI